MIQDICEVVSHKVISKNIIDKRLLSASVFQEIVDQ